MRGPTTLADACTHIVDCEHKTAPLDESGTHFAVGTPAMRGNVINYSESRRISLETYEAWTRRLRPQRGDLLFAREAPVGPIVRIPAAENVAPGQRTVLLRPNPLVVDADFLFYLLSSPKEQALISAKAAGSTVAHLNVADVRTFHLPPLPDIHEQRGIAEVLGALDDKIAANGRLIDKAFGWVDASYVRWISETPFERRSIGELSDSGVLEFGDGYRTKRPEHAENGLRILRAGDVRGGHIWPDGPDFVSVYYRTQMGSKVSQHGDVVLTTKGTVGRVAQIGVADEQVVYSPQVCYFRCGARGGLDPAVLLAWMRSSDRASQTDALSDGSDMAPYVSLRSVRSMTMPVPGEDAVRSFAQRHRPISDRIHSAHLESGVLRETRDALLPMLISGKLRVKVAEAVVGELL